MFNTPLPHLPGLRVELARTPDARTIALLSRDNIEGGLPWRYTEPRIQRMMQDGRVNIAVARVNDQFAGFGIMRYDDESAHLQLLAVDRAWRMHGIGRVLLEWLEKCAVTAGVGVITLETRANNLGARAFYRRLGYTEFAREAGYYLGREDGMRLAKHLRTGALA